jgi:transcriptional regulator with XRE-family HTH domain
MQHAYRMIRRGRRLSLAFLREQLHLTQVQVAKKAKLTQSDISRAEQRSDCRVSTLDRYAKALGGRLRLVIEIDGRPYAIALKKVR